MKFKQISYTWAELFPFGPAPQLLTGQEPGEEGNTIQTMPRLERLSQRFTPQGLKALDHFPHRTSL